MAVGEQYAIETFASTGEGYVNERGDNSHFMIRPELLHHKPSLAKAQHVMGIIRKHHKTLAFCQRFLWRHCDRSIIPTPESLNAVLNFLTRQGKQPLRDYPPLCDVPGSMTSQMEHTLFIRNSGLEVITRGPDY